MLNLVDLFCYVDDFCKHFIPQWQKYLIESGERQRLHQRRMSDSEIMTIIIAFHLSHQRDFKHFYVGFISVYHKKEFPTLLSYTRFIEIMPTVLVPLSSWLGISINEVTYESSVLGAMFLLNSDYLSVD